MRHYSWEHKAKWVGNETRQLEQDQVVYATWHVLTRIWFFSAV